MRHYVIAILCLFFFFHANDAMATDPLKVRYGLYASGFRVVGIEGTYILDDDQNYDLKMDLETAGLLGKLAPWAGVIQSLGRIDEDGKIIPSKHSFASTWKSQTETSTFTFDRTGELKSYIKIDENGKAVDKMPSADIYADKPLDMLGALFAAMNGSNGCAGTYPTMDGKRRFDMVFRDKGIDTLTASRYSIFQGRTNVCDVEIVPKAGKWHDKPRGWMSIQEQAKENGQLPRLWFGKVRDDMPPIPVRFLIKTNYGAMVMHLESVVQDF